MTKKLARRGSHRKSRTVKGWGTSAPQRVGQKLRVFRRCGAGAFLRFNAKDPAASGYPIVATRAKGCQPDCRGLRAAYARARQQGHGQIAKDALRISKRAGCAWAADHVPKRRRRHR
jgi:hypothetical protein